MNIDIAIKVMKEKVKDSVALDYLMKIPEAIDRAGTEGLRIQLDYVMENVKSWRGDEAKEIKSFVRQWINEKATIING